MPSALFVTTVDITLEAFLLPLADRLRSTGWSVDALANGAVSNERIAAHFDRRFEATWARSPLSLLRLGRHARMIRELVARNDYDVVHVHTPNAAFATRFALRNRRERPKVIYTAHGFHFYEGQRALPHALFSTAERIASPWADLLVTVNREDEQAALSWGVPRDRVRYVPGIGVDTAVYHPGACSGDDCEAMRATLGAKSGDFLVTMIAELAPVKRHAHVLEALALTRAPRLHVCFVGEGALRPELERRAEELGVSDRCTFVGYRRDIDAVLAASDAIMLASEREGLARSVLEGMSSGLPVIGTRTRGIADAVSDAEGWIVAKNDASALSAALDEAASNPTDARTRGSAARARACREFAIEHILEVYEGIYREFGTYR